MGYSTILEILDFKTVLTLRSKYAKFQYYLKYYFDFKHKIYQSTFYKIKKNKKKRFEYL